ncbi:uncharacterized protein LOC124857304 [Girardinichthys multiradiatus]|uniref:uncharacterized protein LOC124857304 n=1 Tax=Girardinichthys multiradiatus TaxID=208333 RepID=UPI001FAC67B0|nr:uncharacterized protein LOC124857304 [Girardinichthys multiradiatus]
MSHTSKINSLLSIFKARKSSRASNSASMKDAHENQEDEDIGNSFSSPRCKEELPSRKMCNSDNFQELKETQIQLENCLQILRTNYYRDHTMIMQALEEGNLRQDVLTKELADLKLYKTETLNFKEEMIGNRVHEATTEIHEALEGLQCRVLKLEQQQPQQQTSIKRPQYTMVGKMLNSLSSLGHFVMALKPSGPMLFALLSGGLLTLMLKYQGCLREYFDLFCTLSLPRYEK